MPPSAAAIARDRRILTSYAAGATAYEIALTENLDPAIVRRVLRDAGIEPGPLRPAAPPPPLPAPLQDADWLRAEYAAKAVRAIARELGCPRDRVYEALDAAGIPRRVNGRYPALREIPPDLAEQAVARYLAGETASRIAEDLKLPEKLLSEMLRDRGVKRTRSEVCRAAQRAWRAAAREAQGDAPARKSVRKAPRGTEAEVLERYAAGESGVAIAGALGLDVSSVYRCLHEHTLSDGSGVVRSMREAVRLRPPRQAKVDPPPAPREPVRKGAQPLPDELVEQVLARYAAGEPAKAIAVSVGVSADRVYRLLKERGVLRSKSEARAMQHARQRAAEGALPPKAKAGPEPPAWPKRGAAWPAELAAKVVERYAAGDSLLDLAREVGVSVERISKLLRARGVVRSLSEASIVREARRQDAGYVHRGDISAEVAGEIVERYLAGASGTELAEAFGLKQCRVYKLLRDAGVLRSKSEAAQLWRAKGRKVEQADQG